MPYNGNRLSMLIVLPKSGQQATVESSMKATSIGSLEKGMSKQRVDVYIPKFTFKTSYSLGSDLAAMGMPTAFSPSAADFSGMSGLKDLFISAVIHQAYVAVDEEGTEAAAATAVVMMTSVAYNPNPIPVFRADHPFIFFIVDNTTGEILFMGRVTDPTQG
jgi:serpin B